MAPVSIPGSPEKKQQSRDARKVLALLAKKLKPLGFQRTKPTFFIRPAQFVIEFVHVHKYTFGPYFRVHLGVRVRTDDSPAAALNGPASDGIPDPGVPGRRLHDFEFTSGEDSWESCAEVMHRWVSTDGLRWFASVASPSALLAVNSPLSQGAKAALRHELEHSTSTRVSEPTQRALNAA